MKKNMIGVGVLLAVAACMPTQPAQQGTEEELPVRAATRLIESGAYGVAASQNPDSVRRAASLAVARDAASYRALWNEHVKGGEPPSVDFSGEMVLFLLAGVRSTGGYSIDLQSAAVENGALHVVAPIRGPGRDGIVTMAFTSPFAVVTVPRSGIRSAEWRDGSGNVIAREQTRTRPVQ